MATRSEVETHLEAIDARIREGQLLQARLDLVKAVKAGVPKPLLGRAANLLRRVDLNLEALKLLSRRVRPRRRELGSDATPMERAEYGAALANLGASDEALGILGAIKSGEYPPALLFRAFALMGRWAYADVVPLLRDYVGLPALTPYERMVGEVNLAAALVFERAHTESRELLGRLLERTRAEGRKLLEGNLLELLTQVEIQEGKLPRARELIAQARALVEDSGARSSIYIEKWSAVAESLAKPASIAESPLVRFREKARRESAWETIRDTDRHLALSAKSPELAAHVAYGSHAAAFRARMLSDWEKETRTPLEAAHRPWLWDPTIAPWKTVAREETWDCDVLRGELRPASGKRKQVEPLKPGQLPHRLLAALVGDFYRPWTIAALHGAVFSDRYFHPETSPGLIHQAVFRLKDWIRANSLPLKIETDAHAYRLVATAPFRFGFEPLSSRAPTRDDGPRRPAASSADKPADPTLSAILGRARAAFAGNEFTSTDLAKLLGVSERTARRHLVGARAAARVEARERGRSVSYVLKA